MVKASRKICVTGGAGYIGSHMVRLLLEKGCTPVIFDNLSTGHREFIPKGAVFVKGDLRREQDIARMFKRHKIHAVIHFAASIVVTESVADPLKYYENNVTGTINLLKAMADAGVRKIIFSSSACVYGQPERNPVTEKAPLKVESPYGATKVMAEQVLSDLAKAGRIQFMGLRYFNVAGAHPSGEIGIKMERPTHLIPSVMKVLSGKSRELRIFGTDYPTRDGSCIRDYVHVMDLCEAHWLALQVLDKGRFKNEFINLGNGRGFTVKEVVATAQKVLGIKAIVRYEGRRPGDCAAIVASNSKARKLIGWSPKRSLEEIIVSAWGWESRT